MAVEICPTSNVHTGAISAVAEHPARQFVGAGVTCCPSCDNALLSSTTVSAEYAKLGEQCGFSSEELRAMATKAHTARFG